jgi:hypothetical protein
VFAWKNGVRGFARTRPFVLVYKRPHNNLWYEVKRGPEIILCFFVYCQLIFDNNERLGQLLWPFA